MIWTVHGRTEKKEMFNNSRAWTCNYQTEVSAAAVAAAAAASTAPTKRWMKTKLVVVHAYVLPAAAHAASSLYKV